MSCGGLECHPLTTLNYSLPWALKKGEWESHLQADRDEHVYASARTYGEFHMLAELMQLREEGGLIVLEGCCTPRGHVLEQFIPQAIERAEYVFSAAIACVPEWQASLIICVSVVDRFCKCVPHRCASACVCQSAYVCAFALVYASVSMYKS